MHLTFYEYLYNIETDYFRMNNFQIKSEHLLFGKEYDGELVISHAWPKYDSVSQIFSSKTSFSNAIPISL